MTLGNVRTVESLINSLVSSDWDNFKIVFLLGAGCSRSSGLPGARELASRWLNQLNKQQTDHDLSHIKHDNIGKHYFEIFEKRFTESERRGEIAKFTKYANPGLGYVAFANLIASANSWGCKDKKRFSVILTTNFDNLIEQSFILYTTVRPVVIPDSSLIRFLGDNEINIVKLHGDSRFESFNTNDSTKELSSEVREGITAKIGGSILVVLGYGGEEEGIAQIIGNWAKDRVVKQIWWVDTKMPGEPIQRHVLKSTGFSEFYRVEHADFDKFMLSLSDAAADIKHVSATKMDQHIFRYHDRLMWRVGLHGQDGQDRIHTDDTSFTDYFSYFSKASKFAGIDNQRALKILHEGYRRFKCNANYNILLATFYKTFMCDRVRAEKYLLNAIGLAPEHAAAHAELAILLKEDSDAMALNKFRRIVSHFKKAKDNDPSNWNNTLNYAGFLLASEFPEENSSGADMLRDCAEHIYERYQIMELSFYAYAHRIPRFDAGDALRTIYNELSGKFRSPDFDLSVNVQRAKRQNHPEIELVNLLASAITGRLPDIAETLTAIKTVLSKYGLTLP